MSTCSTAKDGRISVESLPSETQHTGFKLSKEVWLESSVGLKCFHI